MSEPLRQKVHPDYAAWMRRALGEMTRAKASEAAQQQIMPHGMQAAEYLPGFGGRSKGRRSSECRPCIRESCCASAARL